MPLIMCLLNVYYFHKLVEILRPAVRWKGGQILLLAIVRQTRTEQGMDCAGLGCTMVPHTSFHISSELQKYLCAPVWADEDGHWFLILRAAGSILFQECDMLCSSAVTRTQGEISWLISIQKLLLFAFFAFCFGSFCRIVRCCLLRATCYQSWEESSCSCDDQVCY